MLRRSCVTLCASHPWGDSVQPDEDRARLAAELGAIVKKAERNGLRNYYWTYGLVIVSVIAIVVATIVAGIDGAPGWFRSLVTAAAGLAVLVSESLSLQKKTRWHWKKAKLMQRLLRRLTYENADLPTIAKEMGELEETMEDEWPGFGMAPPKSTNLLGS
jgi:hypothetical protein